MDTRPESGPAPNALVVGATRGLGRATTAELLRRSWSVIGTARDLDRAAELTGLREGGRSARVERLDVRDPEQVRALRSRLDGVRLDLLLVCAGTTSHQDTPIGAVPDDAFAEVLLTNALGPARVVDLLLDLVADDGVAAVMSSGQGSIADNVRGGRETYRASKAALNMLVRSIAARRPESGPALVLLAPGWIATDLGGPGATYTLEESVPLVLDTALAQRGRPGLAYVDRTGSTVPW